METSNDTDILNQPVDGTVDLLPDFLPTSAREDGAARDFELLEVLQQHFRSARSEQGSREVVFPNSDSPALRAVFNRDGRLISLHALGGLTSAGLTSLKDHVRRELVETTGLGVGRDVLFSLAPVEGCWRYRDRFQILPVPPHAPRPGFAYARHPFLLEFRYARSGRSLTDHARRVRAVWPVHLALGALLTTPVWWDSGRTVGTQGHAWVLSPPPAEGQANWQAAYSYCQQSYGYPGYTPVSHDFSPLDGIPPIGTVPATEYYADPYRTTGEALVIPDDLAESFHLFLQAGTRRRQFQRSGYWLNQLDYLASFSLSFICAVQAIDALLPPAPPGTRCLECNLEKRPSRTGQFVNFLGRFAPSPAVTDADRKALFEVRSGLSHGFRDPLLADMGAGMGLHPEDHRERDLGTRAVQTARVALHNWLHSPESAD